MKNHTMNGEDRTRRVMFFKERGRHNCKSHLCESHMWCMCV